MKFIYFKLCAFLLLCVASQASVVVVTGFTQIHGGIFYDAPSGNVVDPVTLGPVTVSFTPSFLDVSFAAFDSPQLGQNVPGDGAGFGASPFGFAGAVPVVLDFNQPVTAVGLTFQHVDYPRDHSFTFPVNLEVFSGLDGTGAILGMTTDPGGGTLTAQFADFRGLWSSSPNIRSAIISATAPHGGYLVDGFAISEIPTPEPPVLVLAIFGFIVLGLTRFPLLQ